jgi:hypothetical protein
VAIASIDPSQSPSIMASFLLGIQINVDFIADLLEYAVKNGVETVESVPRAEEAWSRFCQALAEKTLLLQTESFWTGANIASKPRPEIVTVYTGGVKVYADRLDDVAAHDYKGFSFEPDPRPAGVADSTDVDEAWVRAKVDELLQPGIQG